ncbi:MAG TPA: hypothetical protein DHV62_05955 [Elusimicrobia bacterium]|jgi:hypothetical protein|nr:hypothetical protein [Elusimicrobiota bacterium]
MKKVLLVSGLIIFSFYAQIISLSAEIVGPVDLVKKGATYTGSDKCKMCHAKLYAVWAASKHSVVFARLQSADLRNSDCLRCHTTAFETGGYSLEKSTEVNKKFENVTCEGCHGPGSLHITKPTEKENIIKATKECSNCHK